MTRRGFTLLEMLLATVLAAVLMAGVLASLVAVSRDRVLLEQTDRPDAGGAADLVAWDLRSAQALAAGTTPDVVLVVVGNGGLDRDTLRPNGRRVRVTYRVSGDALWRQQQTLDDPARPQAWQTLVAGDVVALSLDPPATTELTEPPGRTRVRLSTKAASADRVVNR